jgi:hypothetical protein
MKKILIAIAAGATLSGCSPKPDNKAQEWAVLDTILNLHDNMMGEDGHLMSSKMFLDSLLKKNPAPTAKDSINSVIRDITKADSAMGAWMHNYSADLSKKSHDQRMDYLHKQKKQILSIDTEINKVIKRADAYIKTVTPK